MMKMEKKLLFYLINTYLKWFLKFVNNKKLIKHKCVDYKAERNDCFWERSICKS